MSVCLDPIGVDIDHKDIRFRPKHQRMRPDKAAESHQSAADH